ncbi:sugar phosphate isomerase/epimerase family protein [Phycisphaera mikurensis]|uniref:Xylose isomerase-like TIM barrel domain-containing protein n=1 Tax=Phycisphaera mikurensis (strain NBRC 102666 / KCTC 22515 / FYK2301M01) TaxID=1142394 RepID=I0ICT1_PHYMF|nr:sugar phosphate isomerase/epimerase family protein [Phycisphaera mikurensis]MBB6443311.1 hexulose-6-phosphate isomerase [Phycisphaera mikurensis]BAM03069.1 hypothetical protein PSMK_09100 [Phycisphaera mikurensis NBRC 102666]
MLSCISFWSTRHGISPPDAPADADPLETTLAAVAEAGFDGIEMCIGRPGERGVFSTDDDARRCAAIRQAIDDAGLVCETAASGMSWTSNPVSEDADVRAASLAEHEEALRRAADLGAEALLYVPGVTTSPISPGERVRYDHAWRRVRENVARLLDTAERLGIDLCLENVWNGLFYSPLELAAFVDGFGSERLGVYLDVGNLPGLHQHPPHWIEILDHRIRRVHVKDYAESFGEGQYAFRELTRGDVPLVESVAALRSIGYDRTVTAEIMPWRPGLLADTAASLRDLIHPEAQGPDATTPQRMAGAR